MAKSLKPCWGEISCSFMHAPKKVNRELLHKNVFLTSQTKLPRTICTIGLTSKLTLNTPKNTNRIFSVANSNWACSILIVNRGIVASPTFNGNPALFVIPCNLLGRGNYRFTMVHLLSLTK